MTILLNYDKMYYNNLLSNTVKLTKEREDEKGMCKIIEEIVERECKEIEKKTNLDTARKMLEKGKYSVEEIAELLELSVSEVENLKNK